MYKNIDKIGKKRIFSIMLLGFVLVATSCNAPKVSHESSKVISNVPISTNNDIDLTINFIIPDYIYNSKDDLFNDFFSSFYNFIITEYPNDIPHLNSYGVYTLDDALRICKEWTYGDGTGLPLVGKVYSPYFLYMRQGSNFVEQKDKNTFLGYCLKNNKFVDFFYFLRTFFYHFRIDEGYVRSDDKGNLINPEGADYFASSYASVIDTAKFFIYSKDDLPYYFYITDNIPNLYDQVPGLLKTPFTNQLNITYDTLKNEKYNLPNNFNCYGFEFCGWYLDKGFNSEKIFNIDESIINQAGTNITLYGKFERVGRFAEEINKDFPN